MSWIIQSILRSSVEIKAKSDINSDEYNDLLVIEKKIEDLHKEGLVSEAELSLIKYMEDGKPIVNSKEEFGKNRLSLAKDFITLCNKLAFYLGDYFTDDGYAEYMKQKYSLNDEELSKMITYMSSKYKHKLMRKAKNGDTTN